MTSEQRARTGARTRAQAAGTLQTGVTGGLGGEGAPVVSTAGDFRREPTCRRAVK